MKKYENKKVNINIEKIITIKISKKLFKKIKSSWFTKKQS